MGDFQYQPGVSPPPKIEGCVNVNPRTFQAFCSVLGKGDKRTYNKFLKDWDNWGSSEQGHVWYDYTAQEDFIWQTCFSIEESILEKLCEQEPSLRNELFYHP